ncbi:MAG: flavodoxin domain-containing protein [Marinospirillum sp.]|uniref:flavodoxin domain-containing protein n=1 Tax=Marinospirillum sp. TaxID=2183934 RepID=UPI0019F1744E|nr:flavodoxin domain-containing protein [Marinospirillum sp.]MBE0506042.1 flavodoxin domain-containing protein [Marinospirillum sp.]
MADIQLLVGSVYGGAVDVAELLGDIAERAGMSIRLNEMPNLQALDGQSALLVVTSTTGSGELPENLQPLYQQLQQQPVSLVGRPCGVVALGDSSYGETFCAAGQLFEDLLVDLGAVSLQPMLKIDALEFFQPSDGVGNWMDEWLSALQDFSQKG